MALAFSEVCAADVPSSGLCRGPGLPDTALLPLWSGNRRCLVRGLSACYRGENLRLPPRHPSVPNGTRSLRLLCDTSLRRGSSSVPSTPVFLVATPRPRDCPRSGTGTRRVSRICVVGLRTLLPSLRARLECVLLASSFEFTVGLSVAVCFRLRGLGRDVGGFDRTTSLRREPAQWTGV